MTNLEQQLLTENENLKTQMKSLQEQLAYLQRQMFGSKKETVAFDSSQLLPGFEELVPQDVSEEASENLSRSTCKPRKKRERFNQFDFPEDAEVKVIEIDLKDDEKVDPITGKELVCIGEDVTRQLAHVSSHFIIKEIRTKKYALPGKSKLGIITAAKPTQPIPGCRADVSLLAYVLICKYADHLPLYRIEEMLRRSGVTIPRQTLSKWVIRLGEVLEPLGNLLKESILASGRIFTDDSTINLQVKGKGKLQQARIWAYAGGDPEEPDPPLVWFEFTADRKHEYTEKILQDYKGVFHADAYAAYPKIDQKSDASWQACWVHARRYFFNVSNPNDFCQSILADMDELLRMERKAWKMTSNERFVYRHKETKALVDNIFAAVKSYRNKHPFIPKGNLKTAVDYILKYEKNFKVFFNHPNARIENNVAERFIRPMTIGRKNWLFIGSMKAGKSAATIMSLVQTCRRLKINPQAYLEDVLCKVPDFNQKDMNHLLPQNWKINS